MVLVGKWQRSGRYCRPPLKEAKGKQNIIISAALETKITKNTKNTKKILS
ncbi:hypothetical protein GBA52_022361 [Prunus armeniaca]|nr:hypothetical protein GBA52_022361 [Prunus armeniaca]